jgi:hypothetical protein
MKSIKLYITFCLLLLTACSAPFVEEECPPNVIIDYIDAIKLKGINYVKLYEQDISNIQKGEKVGEITYTLSGNACSNYKMKDGDATFLQVGTPIYKVDGYKQSFRLMTGNGLYQATGNPNAETVKDFYDIEDKVLRISIESNEDGSHIKDFAEEYVQAFMNEFFSLNYVDPKTFYDQSLFEGERIFLRIHLQDGTSISFVYWEKNNVFSFGAIGNDKLKTIIKGEVPLK